jgi:hypothetical protein
MCTNANVDRKKPTDTTSNDNDYDSSSDFYHCHYY